jgi:hypothetical protein
MTLQEAYIKAKAVNAKRSYTLLISCGDYGAFWGFVFMPTTYNPNDSYTIPNGSGETTVNKETGEIGEFFPPMDLDLFDKRIPIPIEQFAEYNVAI